MASGVVPHNLAALLEAQLSPQHYNLLREAGRLADELGMAAYLVGGPVRDMLLSRPSADLDVVVEGNALQFAPALAEQLGVEYSLHEEFMTATLQLSGGDELDVATARRERYEFPGALPTIQPANLHEDLWRRDFSINAMAVALSPPNFGQLYDPCGGYSDLEKGIVRILNDHSFRDDPTRIIRAVECEVRFEFHMDEPTENLLTKAVSEGTLAKVSPQRCRDVLLPLLQVKSAVAAILRLSQLGILAALGLGEVTGEQLGSVLQQVPHAWSALHSGPQDSTAALVYLSLLAHQAGCNPAAVATHIHLSRDEQKAVDDAIRFLRQPPSTLLASEVRHSELYFALEALSLVGAVALWAAQQPVARRRIEEFWHQLRGVGCDIDGDDLIAAGAQPGPGFAGALREALRLKLDNPQATAEQQLAAALAYLAGAAEM